MCIRDSDTPDIDPNRGRIGPWSTSVDVRLANLFADETAEWNDEKIACIASLIDERGSEPSDDQVLELYVFYCDPTGYIDTWSQTLTLPTAPGAEPCFAQVFVEEAVAGETRDAAWFIQHRFDPPQPQRDNITNRLASECGLTEQDWLAAGLQRESSTTWRSFCIEAGDVGSTHSGIRFDDQAAGRLDDPATYAQRLRDELDDFARLAPPPDLAADFQSFLTARQLLIDFIVENQLNDQQYGEWLSDGRVSNEAVGVSDELDVAWGRFQRVLYQDCPAIELG